MGFLDFAPEPPAPSATPVTVTEHVDMSCNPSTDTRDLSSEFLVLYLKLIESVSSCLYTLISKYEVKVTLLLFYSFIFEIFLIVRLLLFFRPT